MQNDVSKFVVNIVPLQNVNSNISGVSPVNILSNQVANIQKMVNFDQKRIYTNTLGSFTTGQSINVVSPLSLCNVGITSNGTTVGGMNSLVGSFSTLSVTGTGTFGGTCYAQQFVTLSDILSKEEIKPLEPAQIRGIEQLQPYSFHYKGSDQPQIGFLAQEVESVLSNCVKKNIDGTSYVQYDGILATLVGYVNHLSARVRWIENQFAYKV
jgi:hypothetical protein